MKNILKKTVVIIAVMVVGIGGGVAKASTLVLTPGTVNVTKGQVFNVAITLDSQGAQVYTAKANLKFPANLVRADAFTFDAGWFPLVQAGYDAIDNVNGILLKTAGFPGGSVGRKLFGTARFTAIANGTGAISAGAESLALDGGNNNTLTGTPSVAISISAPAPVAPAKPAAPKTETPAPKPLPTLEESVTSTEEVAATSTETATSTEEAQEPSSLTANLVGFVSNTGNLLRLVFAIIFAGAAAVALRMILGKKKEE